MPSVEPAELRSFAAPVLVRGGMPAEEAEVVARCLVAANLRGLDSHGVLRLRQYVESMRAGRVAAASTCEVVHRGPTHALVDAGGGYGYVPTLHAAELAAEMSSGEGVGAVGVRNSHHFGMGALYAERVSAAGEIGIVLSNTGPVLAQPGARRPVVGNNPLAIAVPRRAGQPPIVLDMALSQTAFGRIRLAAREGRPIPTGWAMDVQGRPTTDAEEALRAGLLAPVGGHKGLALAIMVDLLTGVLTGSPFGRAANAHDRPEGGVGHLVLAVSPGLFGDRAGVLERVEELVAELRSADGDVLLPGEPERRTQDERLRSGVPISDELVADLDDLADALGLARLSTIRQPRRSAR